MSPEPMRGIKQFFMIHLEFQAQKGGPRDGPPAQLIRTTYDKFTNRI